VQDGNAASTLEGGSVRRIINSTYVTLDGVIEAPQNWMVSTGERGKQGDEIQADLLLSCDALIMGRRTYESFAPAWAPQSGDPMSDHINSMRKYVASSTLTEPEWENTTVISGDPVEEIRQLKDSLGGNIVQYGFGELSFALMGGRTPGRAAAVDPSAVLRERKAQGPHLPRCPYVQVRTDREPSPGQRRRHP
jgi:dihydrofolate reductase